MSVTGVHVYTHFLVRTVLWVTHGHDGEICVKDYGQETIMLIPPWMYGQSWHTF